MKYLAMLLVLCAMSSSGSAQTSKEPQTSLPPGRTSAPATPAKSYPDSVKFKEAFKEIYALIKPPIGIRERTTQTFLQMSRNFKARGVDSSVAWDSVKKKIDTTMDEKLMFDAYRKEFTAEELKAVTVFMKSPAGKHYFEVEQHLNNAKSQLASYVQRSVSSTIGPMMKPIERPAGANNRLGGTPGHRPGLPGMMRDSLGRPIPPTAPPGTPPPTTPPAGNPDSPKR